MKRTIVALLALLLFAASASAAKAAPSGTITANQPGDHVYGDQLTYSVTTSGLKGNQHPMVEVACYQDVNGDGEVTTGLFNGDLAWLALSDPSHTFTLGANPAPEFDPSQPSSCVVTLYAYGWKGGQESIVPLDSLSFNATP